MINLGSEGRVPVPTATPGRHRDQYEGAIQDYDEAYYVRGLIYGELGKSDEAARDFAKAKELGDP